MLFKIIGPIVADDGSAWGWKGDPKSGYEAFQKAGLSMTYSGKAKVLKVSTGPIIVTSEVAKAIELRFEEDFTSKRVKKPSGYVQLLPRATVTAEMEDENTLCSPLRVEPPAEARAGYSLLQNPPFLVFSEECIAELKRWEPTLEVTEVAILEPRS
ncbi:MAG TPA: hypothetical protein VER11_24115 [Polyangiaceae bacterium]|nr:hypothetical protein [Polyangiaceae bacterium]